MNNPQLLSCNTYDTIFTNKFLVVSKCLERLYPDTVTDFKKEWENVVTVCMEEEHFNKLLSKLTNILSLGSTSKIGFLTIDGSPHCIQVHFAERYLKRALKYNIQYEHYVIDDKGKVQKISSHKIDMAKLLAD